MSSWSIASGLEVVGRELKLEGIFKYLPAAHAEQESHHIGLLLLVELFNVFKGTHLYGGSNRLANIPDEKSRFIRGGSQQVVSNYIPWRLMLAVEVSNFSVVFRTWECLFVIAY